MLQHLQHDILVQTIQHNLRPILINLFACKHWVELLEAGNRNRIHLVIISADDFLRINNLLLLCVFHNDRNAQVN